MHWGAVVAHGPARRRCPVVHLSVHGSDVLWAIVLVGLGFAFVTPLFRGQRDYEDTLYLLDCYDKFFSMK